MQYQLYKYINEYKNWSEQIDEILQTPPYYINFKCLDIRLHKQMEFYKGELRKITYYEKYDIQTNTYSIPVVEETFTYARTTENFAYYRLQTIKWYYTDGTISSLDKKLEKYYSQAESFQEIKRRRKNIIDNLSVSIINAIEAYENSTNTSVDQARAFAVDLDKEISDFIQVGDKTLITRISDEVNNADSTHTFLNYPFDDTMSIADYLIDQLNYEV